MYYKTGYVMRFIPGGPVEKYCKAAIEKKERIYADDDRQLREIVNTHSLLCRQYRAQARKEAKALSQKAQERIACRRAVKWDKVLTEVAMAGLMFVMVVCQQLDLISPVLVVPIGLLCFGYGIWLLSDICRLSQEEEGEAHVFSQTH